MSQVTENSGKIFHQPADSDVAIAYPAKITPTGKHDVGTSPTSLLEGQNFPVVKPWCREKPIPGPALVFSDHPDSKSKMELYGSYTSPFVRHCRIVLLESRLKFKFIESTSTDAHNPSPTKKVPYLSDGDLGLSDSSSIIKHVRDKVGQPFLPDTRDFDLFCFVNTLMDAAINTFLFERVDGLLPKDSKYLTRQVERVESGLTELEGRALSASVPGSDASIRLACFLDWGRFRSRFELDSRPQLKEFLGNHVAWTTFAETAPPEDA